MSIADHFEQVPDAGFVRDYDTGSARRQFNVSLALLVVLTMAVTALGMLVRFEKPVADPDAAVASAPSYAGTLTR